MSQIRKAFIVLISFLLIAVITACGNSSSSKDYFSEDHPEAKSLYNASCIACHATDLSGHVGIESNLQKVGAKRSKEEIVNTIKYGKGQMPPQESKLSEEDIEHLANWLITLQ